MKKAHQMMGLIQQERDQIEGPRHIVLQSGLDRRGLLLGQTMDVATTQ